MKTLPNKDHSSVFSCKRLCLPMDVGVIPQDDSARLLGFVLKRLDLTPLYEAHKAYSGGGKRRSGEIGCGG
ncbi:MAG: hypothetical protein LBF60_04940 [Treponema sp.]|nr:hypothetical protein [Treponema sp.]